MELDTTISDWFEEVQIMDRHQPNEWETVDRELFTSQYGYIKLGFLLTKIRNTCAWKYCAGKFQSFKNWCTARISLEVWQANQYIEAAQIAMYLAQSGCETLPKNLSQCLALRKAYHAEETYYGERPQLSAAWAQVTNHYQPHQITAGKIHAIVDPDWLENQPSKIEKSIVDRAVQQAGKKGMSLNEYLGDLIAADEYEESIEANPPTPQPTDPEFEEMMNALDLKFKGDPSDRSIDPAKNFRQTLDRTVDRFDELMNDLVGQFIPPPRRVANE